jgi:hypothetical protein
MKDGFTSSPPPNDSLLLQSDVLDVMGVTATQASHFGSGLDKEALIAFTGYPGLPFAASGRGINIYLLDSGIDTTHPLIRGAFEDGRINFPPCLSDSALPYESGRDRIGHGTMCAAALLAVAPEAAIHFLPIFLAPSNSPASVHNMATVLNLGNLALATVYAAKNKPSILSLSWGYPHGVCPWKYIDTIKAKMNTAGPLVPWGCFGVATEVVQSLFDICAFAESRSLIVCAAAGNKQIYRVVNDKGIVIATVPGNAIMYPAALPTVISVGGAWPHDLNWPVFKGLNQAKKWCLSRTALSGTFNLIAPDAGDLLHEHAEVIGVDQLVLPDLCGVVGEYSGLMDEGPPDQVFTPDEDKFNKLICVAWSTTAHPGLAIGNDPTDLVRGWVLATGGTSFAAPTVAGVISLVLARFPGFPNDPPAWGSGGLDAARTMLANACMDIQTGATASGDVAQPGPDTGGGWGVLNAFWLMGDVSNAYLKWVLSQSSEGFSGGWL